MKKVALSLSFLLCAFFSFAQQGFPNTQTISNSITLYRPEGGLTAGRSIIIPVIDTLNNIAVVYRGALTVRPQDSLMYMSDGTRWIPFVSSSNGWVVDSIYVERPLAIKIGTSGASTGKQVIYFLKESGLIAGGIPFSTGCRTLTMPPSIYNINFNQYSSLSTNLVIDTSSATLHRTDRIVGDTFGVVSVIKGTPSLLGLPPSYNPSSQFSLALVTVTAGSGCTPISSKVVYDQAIGVAGGEYDTSRTGSIAVNFNNLDNPYHLTKAAFISTYVDSSQIVFTNTGLQDTVTSSSVLVLPTYLNNRLTNPIQVEFFLNTTSVSNNTPINSYINALDTGNYQVPVIPFSAFGFNSNYFNKIVITPRGYDTSGAAGLYFDYIQIQKGITYTSPSLTLTTDGTSGAATLRDNVLNIPIYSGGGGTVLDTTTTWAGLDSLNSPAVGAVAGDIYLVGTSPTGAFTTHANQIATFGGVSYTFQSANIGDLLYNATTEFVSKWTGISWVRLGRLVIHQGGDNYPFTMSIGSITNRQLNLKTNNTSRFRIDNNGDITFMKLTGAGDLLMGLSATGKTSRVAIGSGLLLSGGTLSSTVSSARFGIEDNTGVQDRSVNFGNTYSFSVNNTTLAQIASSDGGDNSAGFVAQLSGTPSAQLSANDVGGGNTLTLTPLATQIFNNGTSTITTPTSVPALSLALPLSVNGNYADATGNVTISTGGGNSVYNEEFTGSTSLTLTLSQTYLTGTIRLYKNGIRLRLADFTEAGATTLTLNVPRLSGDIFSVDFNY